MINKRKNNTPTVNRSSTFSNIKNTIVAGFGLGVGNELAHRAVTSIMGSRTVEIQQPNPISCQEELKKYEKCLKQNNCIDEQEFYKQCIINNK